MPLRDLKRIAFNRQSLINDKLDAVICALPTNVLLLSGYCPVVGSSIAIATPEKTLLIVPDDERSQAESGFADDIRTFKGGSLDSLKSLSDTIHPLLADALATLKLSQARIGYEFGTWVQPAPYVAMTLYGASLPASLADCAPTAALVDADAMLHRLRVIKTPDEIAHIRNACTIAAAAFTRGTEHVRPGQMETEVAAAFQGGLLKSQDDLRAAGDAFCMSGPNAAKAYGAFARSHQRQLHAGDLVLVHCNSNFNGYWTDITRTYCLGQPTPRQARLYEAVFAARSAAFNAIHAGTAACDVDRAARSTLAGYGFADAFKHPTGHGVGFAAMDHNAQPRLHPLEHQPLEVGMVFNVEPAVYFDNECGLRQCEMVAVTETGYELLTHFQNQPAALILD